MKENSIEEDIKIAVDKFSDNKDIDSAMLIVEKFILGNYILLGGNRGNIVKDSLRYILSDYKRVLKENEQLQEEFKQIDHECERLEEKEVRLIKENEELKEDRDKFKKALGRRITYCNELEKDLFENSSNYVIKKQKVKDKIEELKKKVEELTDDKGYWGGSDLLEQIKVLQELLEKEQ